MREIKFRVWNKELGKMWSWHTIETSKVFALDSKLKGNFMVIPNSPEHILLQYTGLKDKNGKEIYEGDIVKFSEYYSGDHLYKESIGVIEWDQTGYTEKLWIGYADQPDWCEVIGNIYENPELLKLEDEL